eukprot:gnl/TRDRNA2_/TRDRNA2_83980_c0_seq1.p1 gnl/TRDRNA2_/TRDRNA2_83980_c0~~gnl/TRDRNA2_/TRDRNA2_83980_c0_seq1.p1  ORF type:complete len:513 (-),score=50.97 gnl/TRDRNA2_/TRDRNA2_83980_c0_seq1:131-1498(-)
MLSTAIVSTACGAHIVMLLRFLAGFMGGVGGPAACVLAAESVPTKFRASLMYAIFAISSLGFALAGFGMQILMPHFGEDASDRWRSFCIFQTAPVILSLPSILFFVCESPSFCTVQGDVARYRSSLSYIARTNGHAELSAHVWQGETCTARSFSSVQDMMQVLVSVLRSQATLILALTCIEGCKSFMTTGSAYLVPQLFEIVHDKTSVSPSMLFSLAGLAPFAGLVVGPQFQRWLGSTYTLCCFTFIASIAFMLLMSDHYRTMPSMLFALVMVVKACYGPLSVVISLMKVESFATDVRATAYSIVSFLAKVGTVAAPTMAERMKGSHWTAHALQSYMLVLVVDVLACGFLACVMPGKREVDAKSTRALGDFTPRLQAEQPLRKTTGPPCKSYGTLMKSDLASRTPREAMPTIQDLASNPQEDEGAETPMGFDDISTTRTSDNAAATRHPASSALV